MKERHDHATQDRRLDRRPHRRARIRSDSPYTLPVNGGSTRA